MLKKIWYEEYFFKLKKNIIFVFKKFGIKDYYLKVQVFALNSCPHLKNSAK